jgi:hypothetical protein
MSRRISVAGVVALFCTVGLSMPIAAQATSSAVVAPPAANPRDVGSSDAIVAAVYDVLSGTASQPRNWDRFRSLFVAGGRLIPTNAANIRIMSPDEYARAADPELKARPFFEREISRATEAFGPIVHVFSTYESRRAPDDPQPFDRGINSFQLFNDGARWWVVTVYWARERPGNAIPAKYLPSARK